MQGSSLAAIDELSNPKDIFYIQLANAAECPAGQCPPERAPARPNQATSLGRHPRRVVHCTAA
eukprot:1159007-Pelagomonas_calceolata.AAC.9